MGLTYLAGNLFHNNTTNLSVQGSAGIIMGAPALKEEKESRQFCKLSSSGGSTSVGWSQKG